MLHFEWSAFVTADLLRQLAAASGAPLATAQALALRLARLFEHVGGLPYIAEEPTPQACTAQGLGWLDEALGHTLAEAGVRRAPPGLLPGPGNSRCAKLLTARPLLDANQADVDGWRTLPGITVALAQAIVAERDRRGRFAGLDDFEKRVDGIGLVRAAALAGVLSFHGNPAAVASAGTLADWTSRLQTLMRLQHAATPAQALVGAVNQALASVATQAHPASRDGLLRSMSAAEQMNPAPAVRAAWVGELWGKHYWQALPALMDSAAQSIELCMFHVAAPNETHPTYALLQGLVQAHQRGAAVRVLLDRDGKNDPYLSTLINSAARRFLTAAGLACRSDSSSRLLHSKYLVIDRQLVVMGSHNWSAGSYGRFDDLTLAVQSETLATQVLERFDALWASAS
jgi:phosphatidylserine/phosphatidylglycerophosphate/cardiolipin synthase-like enzyme